jgi:hypothetical protein
MANRGSKRTASATQAGDTPRREPGLQRREFDYPRVRLSPATKLVLDAFSKAGITFDPNKKTDAGLLHRMQLDCKMYAKDAALAVVPPHYRSQDKDSRLATERLMSKLKEVWSAILLCEEQAERADIPAMKQNVALTVKENLYQLPGSDHDHFGAFIYMIDDLEWAAAHALDVGIRAAHGKSNTLFQYRAFVRELYYFWKAKKSEIGVYKSGGRWTGPFIELVERCEELLPAYLRPPSELARGKRVARAIEAHKKANAS